MQNIGAQTYNNKLQGVSAFLQYLQVTDNIMHFAIPAFFYKKKFYPKMNEIRELDRKLDLLMIHLSEFPEQLRIMCLILICTGIDKGKMFLLRNADFYYDKGNNWMRVPDTYRSVPIPDMLHWLVLKYAEKNCITIESLLFLNKGKKYTARNFADDSAPRRRVQVA